MNYRVSFLFVAIVCLNILTSNASPKKDKKVKMKKSEMVEAIADFESKIKDLEAEILDLKSENQALSAELDEANLTIAKNEAEKQAALAKAAPFMTDRMPTEVYFKVQLGAYEQLDLQDNFTLGKMLATEVVEGDVKKYVIGEFSTLDAAKKFELDLKKLGVKDAWLVPYKNDSRISDEEASEVVGKDIRK